MFFRYVGFSRDVKRQQRPTVICQSVSQGIDPLRMLLVRDPVHDIYSLHAHVLQIQASCEEFVQTADGHNKSQPNMEGTF